MLCRNVAWEVRKSPSKGHSTFETYLAKRQQRHQKPDKSSNPASPAHNPPTQSPSTVSVNPIQNPTPPSIERQSSSTIIKSSSSSGSCSWADKVRGYSIHESTDHKDPSPNTSIKPDSEPSPESTTVIPSTLEDNEEPIVTSNKEKPIVTSNGDNSSDCGSTHGDNNVHTIDIPLTDGVEIIPTEYDDNKNILPTPSSPSPSEDHNKPTTETNLTVTNVDSWKDMMKQYDEEVERRGDVAWADMCDSPPLVDEEFEELVNMRETRSPGRSVCHLFFLHFPVFSLSFLLPITLVHYMLLFLILELFNFIRSFHLL